MARGVIERWTPHRAKQHGRRCEARLHRIRAQRIVRGSERGTANKLVLKLNLMAEAVADSLQNQHGLFSDFRTNAVAGEDGKFQEHEDDRVIGKFGNWELKTL